MQTEQQILAAQIANQALLIAKLQVIAEQQQAKIAELQQQIKTTEANKVS